MSLTDFDYGAELEKSAGGVSRENPDVNIPHAARLKAIIHLGRCPRNSAKAKNKDPVNMAVAVFELKEESDIHSESGEPLLFEKDFTLMDGDKSFLHGTLIPALVSKADMDKIKSFDDLIGRTAQLSFEGSDKLNEDGTPMYVNLKGMSALHPKLAALTDELKEDHRNGHIRLSQLTVGHMDLLNPYMHVQMLMMKSDEWKAGSHPAIPLVAEIRKDRPKYAMSEAKTDKTSGEGSESQQEPPKGDTAPENLDTIEEF